MKKKQIIQCLKCLRGSGARPDGTPSPFVPTCDCSDRAQYTQDHTTCPEYQEGELPAFTLLGGYTVVYLTTDYDSLCADCAGEEALEDIISWYLAEECDTEEALYCDECGMKLKEEWA